MSFTFNAQYNLKNYTSWIYETNKFKINNAQYNLINFHGLIFIIKIILHCKFQQ